MVLLDHPYCYCELGLSDIISQLCLLDPDNTLVQAHSLTYAHAQVRRSTRAAKPAVSALRKERELDRMLEQHEKREKASWRQRGQAEDEEED